MFSSRVPPHQVQLPQQTRLAIGFHRPTPQDVSLHAEVVARRVNGVKSGDKPLLVRAKESPVVFSTGDFPYLSGAHHSPTELMWITLPLRGTKFSLSTTPQSSGPGAQSYCDST